MLNAVSEIAPMLSAVFLLFGVVLGSFGNVVVIRGSEQKSLLGRSMCMLCGKVLGALELVPVLSFIALRGKCRFCREPISWQYPLVEITSGVLFVLALWLEQFAILPAILLGICLWLLFLIALIDLRTGFVPDFLSIPLIIFAIIRVFVLGAPLPVLPVAIAIAFFGLQWAISNRKWLGSGDIFIAVGTAALLIRFDLFLVHLFFAYILGAVVASILLLTKKKTLKSAIPFGPFLAVSALLTLLWGDAALRIVLP